MKKNITLLLLLVFCLFFLCQSQDVRYNLSSYLSQESESFLSFPNFFHFNLNFRVLHLFFTIIWSMFFLLLFNVLTRSFNLLYSTLVWVFLLPAFLFQGVIFTLTLVRIFLVFKVNLFLKYSNTFLFLQACLVLESKPWEEFPNNFLIPCVSCLVSHPWGLRLQDHVSNW